MSATVVQGDCQEWMREQPAGSCDLVLFSPPYEAARDYGIGFDLRGEDWVAWMVDVMLDALRISRGLVACVVEGRTKQFRYTATPVLLMADLHRAGVHLRKPPAYRRYGIPGSGGPDWLRNDYEFIVCATNGGRLPWSDNTACGHPPKYKTGGVATHRKSSGERVKAAKYAMPKVANPGNVIKCKVGKGHMGSDLAGQNEAPFPESLADVFVRSFCPPDGLVVDPFAGSGTTAAACIKAGRNFAGCDVRASQVELTRERIAEASAAVEI